MKLFAIFILFPILIRSQSTWDKIKQRDDVFHFYGSVIIDESAYQIQSYAFPEMKEVPKVLIANGVTLLCIFGKERFDMVKKHPTGFSWDDVFVGSWAIPVYDIFNTCRYDLRHREEALKIQDGYFEFGHHYLDKYEPLKIQLENENSREQNSEIE